MAIIQTTGGTVDRSVIGSTMITIGAQTQQIARTTTNNRKGTNAGTAAKSTPVTIGTTRALAPSSGSGKQLGSRPSQSYQMLDAGILALDAQYEQLTNKSAWEDFAAEIAGQWQLCANCMPDAAGKKLYRQVTFNRQLLGLPFTSDPSTLSVPQDEYDVALTNQISGPGPYFVFMHAPTTILPSYLIVQLGLASSNPLLYLDNNLVNYAILPPSSIYYQWSVLTAPGPVRACLMNEDGVPCLNSTITVTPI
jgi:hypothetical protein